MKKSLFSFFTILIMLLVSVAVAQQIPMMMNYQGYIASNSSSVLINGDNYFKFAIVNTAGDTTYWSNDSTSSGGSEPTDSVTIAVTDGVYTVQLGDTSITNMTSLATTPFQNQDIYLRVWFSEAGVTFEQFTPDTQLVSAGFAHRAETVSVGAVTSSAIQDNTITNTDISVSANISASKINTSGLNADTVDGQHASAFMPMSTDNWVNESGDTMTGDLTVQGNVGIGTTSPGAELDVNGTIKLTGNSFSYISNHTDAGRETLRLRATDSKVTGSAINLFGTADSQYPGGIKFFTSDSTRMAITSNGRIGIGTSDPTDKLTVAGGVKIQGKTVIDGPLGIGTTDELINKLTVIGDVKIDGNKLKVNGPGDSTWGAVLLSLNNTTGQTWVLGSNASDGSFSIGIAYVDRALSITPSFDVGIGTWFPAEKLHVAGNIYAEGSITEGSSRELKERIQDLSLDEAITALNKLSPQKFYYKADKEDEHIGFIAEDVPELVATQDRKSLSSMDIVAVLTKVVKEQQKIISELSEKVDNLGRDSKLRDSLASADAY